MILAKSYLVGGGEAILGFIYTRLEARTRAVAVAARMIISPSLLTFMNHIEE